MPIISIKGSFVNVVRQFWNIYSLEKSRSSSWKVIMVPTTTIANDSNTNTDVLSNSSVPRILQLTPHPVI